MNDDIRNDAVGFDGSTFLQFSEERRKMRYIFFIHLNKKALDTKITYLFSFL